ncbi:ornithine cyclodeaminase [Mycolicibacterium madagascariense]|uniref:Ornithine cyclodeaminase n=1 Tax=Mycolicibacterium madagascariense TaxID=212765 RepID=A0A7I7XFJ0_9MYCO|nr:tyramine oxidase subunit B [Mycolicibacterium madagascariense]BBZ27947.1 ornithine cyclodeaminase [Mycolicibacterium madagascariense]
MFETESFDTAIDFLYLSEPDMVAAGVTDMSACVDAMEQTFALLHRGDYRMSGPNNDSHGAGIKFPADSPFPTMPRSGADRRFMAMPAYLGGDFGTTGVKWYGSNLANQAKGLPRSILMFMLSDTDTGAPLALMSANLLSAYRTGAVPGVGARHLAQPDSRVVGILGPGVIGRSSLAAFMTACPKIDTVKFVGRDRRSIETFTAWVADECPQITSVIEVDSAEAAVRDSDIVTFCTTGASGDPSTYPTLERDWVKPGAFVSMPSIGNIDAGMEASDVRKVADNTRMYEAWAAEVGYPAHHHVSLIGCKFMDMIHDGTMSRDDLIDLGAIVTGAVQGRRSQDEIVLMSIGGMPVEDVAWGTTLYRNAIAKGIGTTLNLWERPVMA